jgi:hypothetical protein
MFWIITGLAILELAIIVGLVWYVRQLIKSLSMSMSDSKLLFQNVMSFNKHLEELNDMQIYHKEPTIEDLITHSKELLEDITVFSKNNVSLGLWEEDEGELESIEKAKKEIN